MSGRFVALGDSFTEGVGDPHLHHPNGFRGWADRLARQLGRADPDWEYANLAIRSKFLDQVVTDQLEPALAMAPTHISFHAGGNDLLALRTDVDHLLDRYEAAVARLGSTGAQLVLFTTFDPQTSRLLEPLRRRLTAFNDGCREVAQRHRAILVDHAAHREYDDRRLWAIDRIHMSRPGHKRMAAIVLHELDIPHTLKLRTLPPHERRPWRSVATEEWGFVRTEVVPLVRRRLRRSYAGDTVSPKWPVPVRPAEGLKRLAARQAEASHAGWSPGR